MTVAVVKVKDKLFIQTEDGEWNPMIPLDVKEKPEAAHGWSGKKIPMDKVAQVLAFFEWSYGETKSETMAHFYYHPVHGWEVLVLPQKGYTGMTVSLVEDHPGAEEARQRLPGIWKDGTPWDESYNIRWRQVGTWHHHCTGMAFASGTDSHDEKTKEGLHVTIGGVSTGKYSIHMRTSFKGEILGADPADWFELEDVIRDRIPADLHGEIIRRRLTMPPVGVDFPEWWKANVIKVERVQYQQPTQWGVSNNGLPYSGSATIGTHHNCTYQGHALRYNWTSKCWERWNYTNSDWVEDKTILTAPVANQANAGNRRWNPTEKCYERWEGPGAGWVLEHRSNYKIVKRWNVAKNDWDKYREYVPTAIETSKVEDKDDYSYLEFEQDLEEVMSLWNCNKSDLLGFVEKMPTVIYGDIAEVMATHQMSIEETATYLEGWIREEKDKDGVQLVDEEVKKEDETPIDVSGMSSSELDAYRYLMGD